MLTEATARALEPPDELPQATDRLVFDGGTGLALRVLPSGYKGWLWQGRTPAGRMIRLALGEWGRVPHGAPGASLGAPDPRPCARRRGRRGAPPGAKAAPRRGQVESKSPN